MSKYITYILTTLLLTFLSPALLHAQDDGSDDEVFKARFTVGYDRGDKSKGVDGVEYRTVQWAKFKSAASAQRYTADVRSAVAAQAGQTTVGNVPDAEAWHRMVTARKLKFFSSRAGGQFTILNAQEGQAVLITTYSPLEDFSEDDAIDTVIVIKKGVTDYNIVLRKSFDKSIHQLEGVVKTAKVKDTIQIRPAAAIDDGKTLYIPIDIRFPAGYLHKQSRLLIQPCAVNCQNEDTVAYVPGLVFEGKRYHELQSKRMRYDYMKNDNLNYAYREAPMHETMPFEYHTMLEFPKPNRRLTYKTPYRVMIADANHVWFDREYSTSSCGMKSIFKFIDLGIAMADMDPEEFRVEAEDNLVRDKRDLHLKFVVGRDVLMDDSTNTEQINALLDILSSLGSRLNNVRIMGTASPDGGYEKNKHLAEMRASYSKNYMRSHTRGMDYNIGELPAKVYTWDDVAKELERRNYNSEAADVRARMGSNGFGGDAAIKELSYYHTIIEPILDDMRSMSVSYNYERLHKMTPSEALSEYYKRKADLMRGRGEDFSEGDYFNLLTTVRDSVELDNITALAYRSLLKNPGYTREKYSMFICNRMAMLNARRGTPDADVLRPFINTHFKRIADREYSGKVQVNRREILINQIITYILLEQRDTALSYLDAWFSSEAERANPKVERMRKFVDFKELFIPYTANALSSADQTRFIEALQFVYDCAPDNKAILYAEAHNELRCDLNEADALVSQMNDRNPRKWYLKGIVSAAKESERLRDTRPSAGYIPEYMCYFHHSFEMDPSLKHLYFNEGNIDDELRQRYHYRKALIPRYRQMFDEKVNVTTDDQKPVDEVIDEETEFSGEEEPDDN